MEGKKLVLFMDHKIKVSFLWKEKKLVLFMDYKIKVSFFYGEGSGRHTKKRRKQSTVML